MEFLTRDLTTLDELNVGPEDRLKRKEQVQRIQNLITTIDHLLPKVHELAAVIKLQQSENQTDAFPRDSFSAPTPELDVGSGLDSGIDSGMGKGKERVYEMAVSSFETDATGTSEVEFLERGEMLVNELLLFERQLQRKLEVNFPKQNKTKHRQTNPN